jgi:chromosome segregation and condensation protein ScpB
MTYNDFFSKIFGKTEEEVKKVIDEAIEESVERGADLEEAKRTWEYHAKTKEEFYKPSERRKGKHLVNRLQF